MDDEAAWGNLTSVRRRGCSAVDLLAAVQQVHDRYPSARLVRNRVGNLSVVIDDEMVGFLDLTFGRFRDYAEDYAED